MNPTPVLMLEGWCRRRSPRYCVTTKVAIGKGAEPENFGSDTDEPTGCAATTAVLLHGMKRVEPSVPLQTMPRGSTPLGSGSAAGEPSYVVLPTVVPLDVSM